MKLRRLHIKNFRCIKNLELDLDDTTVLIGENNTGKTAVLDAIKYCLRELGTRGRVVFKTFDFHLRDAQADPLSSDPIVITLTFSEDAAGDWPGPLVGKLQRQRIIQVDPDDGRSRVHLRLTCDYKPTEREFHPNGTPASGPWLSPPREGAEKAIPIGASLAEAVQSSGTLSELRAWTCGERAVLVLG